MSSVGAGDRKQVRENEAKLPLSWPLCPPRTPALHWGFGARQAETARGSRFSTY